MVIKMDTTPQQTLNVLRKRLKEVISPSNARGRLNALLSYLEHMQYEMNTNGKITEEEIEQTIREFHKAMDEIQELLEADYHELKSFFKLDSDDNENYHESLLDSEPDRNLTNRHVSELINDVYNSSLKTEQKAYLLKIVALNLNSSLNEAGDNAVIDKIIPEIISASQSNVQALMESKLPEDEATSLIEMC